MSYRSKLRTGKSMLKYSVLAFPNKVEARIALTNELLKLQDADENEESSKVFGRFAHEQARK